MEQVIIATTNKGKVKEFAHRFAAMGVTVQSLLEYPEIPDIVEDGVTFEDNAEIKARAVATMLQKAAIADDSGLCVDALDGAPGVYSARYAGEPKDDSANIAKLLRTLQELPVPAVSSIPVPEGTRLLSPASFECALIMIDPASNRRLSVHGSCPGYIIDQPRGTGGFGYDPVFYLPEYGRTMAELTIEEKQAISHRGKAMDELITILARE